MLDTITTQAQKLVNITKKAHRNSKTKVIAITSGKGGVGKSTLTANISYLLAQRGMNVAVLDADIGLANMQVLFNIKPDNTFFDYIEGEVPLKKILIPTQYENITLCAGKSGAQYANNTSNMLFSRVVEDIVELNEFDILLVDTGAGLNEYVQEFLDAADEILAITTTDPSALTDAYALMKMLSENKNRLFFCFNYTKKYEIGNTITKSIKNLAIKNKLNRNFMVKYLGNVNSTQNISTTGRLRKLFVKEFAHDDVTYELESVVTNLMREVR